MEDLNNFYIWITEGWVVIKNEIIAKEIQTWENMVEQLSKKKKKKALFLGLSCIDPNM